MLEFAFRLDRTGGIPAYRQLEDYLKALIQGRRLVAGERLPPSRELAGQLALSRNTVNHAYRRLGEAGHVVSHVGRGTFVAASLGNVGEADAPPARGFAWESLFSARTRMPGALRAAGPMRRADVIYDFAGGSVDPALLPERDLRTTWSRAIADGLQSFANPSHPAGLRPLREEIALSLVARGIECEAEDVLVVNGAQQALDLLARVLLDPGDLVALEQPGYFGASMAFQSQGARLVGVGVDADGMRIDDLSRVLRTRRVKLVYTTPSAQCPTGAVLSQDRRDTLLALADDHHVPIVEDDYDSELRFGGPPLPALKTRDEAGRVVYLGTFSKALFPGLRLGYVVAARPLLGRLMQARFSSDIASDAISQAAVAELVSSGRLERHVRRLRREYELRRAAMLDALADFMPQGTSWTSPCSGHGVWLEVPGNVDVAALELRVREEGIRYTPGSNYYFASIGIPEDELQSDSLAREPRARTEVRSVERPGGRVRAEAGRRALVLSYANHPPERIRSGVEHLARLIERSKLADLSQST